MYIPVKQYFWIVCHGISHKLCYGLKVGYQSHCVSCGMQISLLCESCCSNQRIQYHLKVLTPLPQHCCVTYLQPCHDFPSAGRFFTEENSRSGTKVAAGKLTEVKPRQWKCCSGVYMLIDFCFLCVILMSKIAPKNILTKRRFGCKSWTGRTINNYGHYT